MQQQQNAEDAEGKPAPAEHHGRSGVPAKHFLCGQETLQVVAVMLTSTSVTATSIRYGCQQKQSQFTFSTTPQLIEALSSS